MKYFNIFGISIGAIISLASINIARCSQESSEEENRIEVRYAQALDRAAKRFNNNPNLNNIEDLLIAIANFANIRDGGRYDIGSTEGTRKHQICKEILGDLQHQYGGAFHDIDNSVRIQMSTGEGATPDVVWVTNNHAYIFDFKFAGAVSGPFQRRKFKEAVEEKYHTRTVHPVIEISPTNG